MTRVPYDRSSSRRSARVAANVATMAVILGLFAFIAVPAFLGAASWWASALASIARAMSP